MNNRTYIVYKHTNNINGKVYIGITKYGENPELRWRKGYGYVENNIFFADILKYGWDNFTHEILEEKLTNIEAAERERHYILKYDSVINGYNQVYGNGVLTDEGRKVISKSLTGIKRKQSSIQKQLETKQKRYGTGRGIHYLGSGAKKVKCNETGDVFACAADANRWASTSKVGECCNGNRKHAGIHPITKKQLSWVFANPEEEITIMCEEDRTDIKKIRKIICIETNQEYESAADAFRKTGIAACNILRVCSGKRKTAGKLHWKFKEEE